MVSAFPHSATKHNPHPLLFLLKSKLCSFPSPKLYTMPTFSFTHKFSQTKAPPILDLEAELEVTLEAEAKPTTKVIKSAAKEEPKREEIFIVAKAGQNRTEISFFGSVRAGLVFFKLKN